MKIADDKEGFIIELCGRTVGDAAGTGGDLRLHLRFELLLFLLGIGQGIVVVNL